MDGVKTLTKVQQFAILGGQTVKIVCSDGIIVSGGLANCHCHNFQDGVFLVMFTITIELIVS
ncbi:hypothetical protein [Kordia sp.]|uniref:hypothetical protein n=1 Tax=Kordia sp. TaxID=1965332 RepID=UPI003D2BC8F9